MVNIFLLLPDGNAIINAGDTPADFKNLLNEVIGLCRKITQYQNVELCYDNENIEEFLNALKNIFAGDEYVYYMKNPDNQLRIILKNKSKNWRNKSTQKLACYYVLWKLDKFDITPVNNTTLAEITENSLTANQSEKYLLLNIANTIETNRKFLTVFKDCDWPNFLLPQFIHIDFVSSEIELQNWWDAYQRTSDFSFNLSNQQKFSKKIFKNQLC